MSHATAVELFLSPTATATELLMSVAMPMGQVLDFSKEGSGKSPFREVVDAEARDLKDKKKTEKKRISRLLADGVVHQTLVIQAYASAATHGDMGDTHLANTEIADLGIQVHSELVLC